MPTIELDDEPPDYVPVGFADIWKGTYSTDRALSAHRVSIKVIRMRDQMHLMEIKSVHKVYQLCAQNYPHLDFLDGVKTVFHPNVLPIFFVTDAQFPLFIISPWMSNGNIIQYIQMNPGVNRLMLVRAHRSGDRRR